MAKIYYRKIRAGGLALEDVPALWREAVGGMLAADAGTDAAGADTE